MHCVPRNRHLGGPSVLFSSSRLALKFVRPMGLMTILLNAKCSVLSILELHLVIAHSNEITTVRPNSL